jgi:heat shock protein HtpX
MDSNTSGGIKAPRTSLMLRGVLAIVLMVGFYALALALAAGLLYIPYAEWTYGNRLHVKLAVFCVLGAGIILWSLLPRIERFVAPGPRLTPDRHPRLFSEIGAIADSVRQTMPAEIYLVPEVNAWVGQRGGLMGIGSKRVMGLGLPLMRVLKVSELRAVLAHEFGHYHGGDTKLGPWVYRTRATITRTLQNLGQHSSVLQKPFLWYGNLFLMITHGVSRWQEYAADRLAARTVGARPLISGLKTIHGAGPAFNGYWEGEVAPVLAAGYRPPIAEGFDTFLRAHSISQLVEKQIASEMSESDRSLYDTHPPLRDRIAALRDAPDGEVPADDPIAGDLLNGIDELETLLLAGMGGEEAVAKLQPVCWADAGEKIHLPGWIDAMREHGEVLSGIRPVDLPDIVGDPEPILARLEKKVGRELSRENAVGILNGFIGTALAVALQRQGGRMSCEVGEPVAFQFGETVIQPFSVVQELAEGELTADAWLEQCAQAGVTETDLGHMGNAIEDH